MSGCLFPLSSSFFCCCSSISSSLSATMCLAGWFLSYCLCSRGVAAFITTSQAVARARLLLLPSSPLPLLLTHRVNPPPTPPEQRCARPDVIPTTVAPSCACALPNLTQTETLLSIGPASALGLHPPTNSSGFPTSKDPTTVNHTSTTP